MTEYWLTTNLRFLVDIWHYWSPCTFWWQWPVKRICYLASINIRNQLCFLHSAQIFGIISKLEISSSRKKNKQNVVIFIVELWHLLKLEELKLFRFLHKTLCFLYNHYYISNSDLGKKGCQTLWKCKNSWLVLFI